MTAHKKNRTTKRHRRLAPGNDASVDADEEDSTLKKTESKKPATRKTKHKPIIIEQAREFIRWTKEHGRNYADTYKQFRCGWTWSHVS